MTLNKTTSIVDYLKSLWEDSSFTARKKLAQEFWIKDYRWTAEQNKQLLTSYNENKNPASDPTPTEAKNDIQKALSLNDMNLLKEAIKKYWEEYVMEKIKWSGKSKEIIDRLQKTKLRQSELDNKIISDKTIENQKNTDKIVEELWPKETIFPQYEQKVVTDEERKNIEEVQKSYYEPYFNRQKWELTTDYNVDKLTLDRLSEYANTDTAKDLAKINQTFAKAMSRATNAYGQRNLLSSWIMKSNAGDQVDTLWKDEQNREEYNRRQQEGYTTSQENIKTKFERGLTNISENQDAQTYFDTLKEIQNRQSEYNRQYDQSQENIDFSLTTNIAPTNKTYENKDLKNKQNLLF